MNKRLRLPLALSLALGSSSAMALGLGQIEVKSALNQPLAAEIPVLSTQPGETDALAVRLAPPEALARVGLQAPSGVAANLEFAVDTNARGEKIIRVSTPDKVVDPFVTFLLEVDWGSGKMLREYTVLLDPPTMAPVRHTATAAPVSEPSVPSDAETVPLADAPPPPEMRETPAPEPATDAPVTESEPAAPEPVAEAEPAAEPEPAPAPPEPEPEPARARTDNYGPVQEGETLWQIAQFARPDDSVTMSQMMLALLYANPDAFIDQNINRLKRGAVLRIPTKEESLAVAAAEAAAQVREQSQAWSGAAPSVPQPAETQPDEVADTRPAAAPASSTADSRLELVPPRGDAAAAGAQSGATVAGEGAELRAELARSREQVSTLSAENVELKARVGELEKIQGDSAKLLELKDSELAAAQKRLAELEARAAAAPAADAAPAPATDATAPVAGEDTGIDPSVPPLVEAPPADTGTPASDTTSVTPATDAAAVDATAPDTTTAATATTDAVPAETAPATPATEPLPERPPQAPIWTNPWVIGGVALVIVGLLALLLGRRRSAAAATSAAPSRYDTGAVASSIAAVQADAARRQAAPASASDDDHLDDLVAAVSRDPGNLARHLELVRYYYDANDAAGFENAAEAMYSRVYDPDDLAWKQVLAMGQEIAPEHPLFIVTEPEPAPVPVPAPTPAPVLPPVKAAPVVPPPPVVAPGPPVREIDWGQPAPKPVAMDNAATQKMRIEDVRTAAREPEPEPTFESVPELDDSFAYEPAPAADDGSAGFVDADAASTKLELARAYLDMGDVEGARGMLEEVVGEGNPGQRAEAKRLLDEIR